MVRPVRVRVYGRRFRVAVKIEGMVQIGRPAPKGILRVRRRKELLKVCEVIQLKMVTVLEDRA